VKIREVDVRVRQVSYNESRAIARAFPRPFPPLIKDPAKGSAAPKIPDTADPEYRLAVEHWSERIELAELGVAMQLGVGPASDPIRFDPKDPEAIRSWATLAVQKLGDEYTVDEINRLRDAVYSLDSSVRDAAGN
jgi:hypothetical protein